MQGLKLKWSRLGHPSQSSKPHNFDKIMLKEQNNCNIAQGTKVQTLKVVQDVLEMTYNF